MKPLHRSLIAAGLVLTLATGALAGELDLVLFKIRTDSSSKERDRSRDDAPRRSARSERLARSFETGPLFESTSSGPAPGRPVLPLPPAPAPGPQAGPAAPELWLPPADPVPAEPVVLYRRVKYKDYDEMHPCAVPMVVCVPDPCACRCRDCRRAPKLVNVLIHVPPRCGPPKVKHKTFLRNEYEYDFGKYGVDVRLKKGYIEVDYQD